MDDVTEPRRGPSDSHMRAFVCKECRRDVERLEREVAQLETASGRDRKRLPKVRSELAKRRDRATYNENWARNVVERGGSRSDRCREHRQKHRTDIQGMAVAYIDVETVGEVADRENPTGPLGGLGPLPTSHEIVEGTTYDLEKVNVGMTDEHIVEMVRLLRDRRVLILKAGTGTGKSTFAPYRLMDPPPASLQGLPARTPFGRLTELGPIVVTEPRVQAAVGVASFVGGVMSGAGGVGPGFPVGYQVSGDRAHDDACELIYVTDGTMINWLREGRLSRIGTVIVDEAHERSTNIDFIMGFLRRELDRYPHLRVIITSATFNVAFYQEFFDQGRPEGPPVAHVMEVPAEKAFGYGMPLFPALDTAEPGEDDVLDRWSDEALPLSSQQPRDDREFVRRHWPTRLAPALSADDVTSQDDEGYEEDVWNTTARLLDLRYTGNVPTEQWRARMPDEMADFVVQLAQGLDERGIYGDILAFLPTKRTIEPVVAEIERRLGRAYEGHVFPLISSLKKDQQKAALAKRRKGDPRKIVISTNLAETSLTVEGVRFVVDSGLIAQSEWDPDLAKGDIPTKPHSQAGIKQRWGRVGRKAPGWVFPLYSKGQYLALAEDTPPGSTRENLEALVMTARMGGIDDVLTFPWPAAFEPTTTELDDTARRATETFRRELVRADAALRAGGAVDGDGHPTSFGRELIRFQGLGSTGSALAILYADRLTCVPEVVTVLALLEDARLVGRRSLLQDEPKWPDEWRLEAADRHRGLASLCADDAELVLLIAAAWDRADPSSAPWEQSEARHRWARQWWINHELLLETARKRQDVLSALSPAMKEQVKRFLELSLIDRVRGVLTRSLAGHRFRQDSERLFTRLTSAAADAPATVFSLEDDTGIVPVATEVIALRRRESRTDSRVSSLVAAQPWALPEVGDQHPTGPADAIRMVVAASRHAPARPELNQHLALLESWPVGQRIRLRVSESSTVDEVLAAIEPFPQPTEEPSAGRRSRRRRPDTEDAEATRADSDGELRLPGVRIGYADEDTVRADAFRRNDREIEAYAACGECPRCLAGQTTACEQLTPARSAPAGREDPVRAWRAAARRGIDVSVPAVELPDGSPSEDDWYEVVAYRPGDDRATVVLRPDWRAGARGNPASHHDVQAGDPIEVTVGPVLRHHGGPLRAFDRVDGRGRFVLAEASSHKGELQEKRREIAASLHRGSRGLLESLAAGATLVATVMPARSRDCYTITLLELLHQHLGKASAGSGIEYQATDPTQRTAARTRLFNAIVSEPPDESGRAQAVLLHRDSARGIRHVVTLFVRNQADEPAPVLGAGQPLLLHLVRDRSRLDVSDLDLAALREIVRHSNRQLELSRTGDQQSGPDDQDDELAPPGTALLARSEQPLSRSAATRLAELSDDPQWANEVWSFWARTHHLTLNGSRPYRPGTRTEPAEASADVVVAVDSPLEEQRRLTKRFADQHPVGSVVQATVLTVLTHGAYAELVPGLEGLIPIRELSWSFVEDPTLVATPGDIVRLLVTSIPDAPDKIELSLRRLTPKPYQLYAARHDIGDQIEAVVNRVTDGRVFVDIEPGVSGSVHIAQLSYQRLDTCADVVAEGDRITAKIIKLDDERERVELSVKQLQPPPYEVFRSTHPVNTTTYGTVRNATRTHVYVDLDDGVTGVVFRRDLAHRRVEDAALVAQPGETMMTLIKGYNDQREQVELSRKALIPKPFAQYRSRHRAGEHVDGVVSRTSDQFVFLDLEEGVSGRIHVQELDHARVHDVVGSFPPGSWIRCQILDFKDDREMVLLSRKALIPKPYAEYRGRHWVGQHVDGFVSGTSDQFVFLDLGSGVSGRIHARELDHNRVHDIAATFPIGTRITAQILEFKDDRDTVSLSRKALLLPPYDQFKSWYAIGSAVQGTVNNLNQSFVYVTLTSGVTGIIHISRLAAYRVGHPSEVVSQGQWLTARVVGFNDERKQVELSLRD
ncbi:S1 RNA-binding domain-containing protein [Micromonospora sp. SCSIO 07396]